MQRRSFIGAMLGAAAGAAAFPARAAGYPSKPVRIVVPYTAGGNLDIIGRLVAHMLEREWKQPVVVENRPGANGNIGTESIVRAAPDGYNLAMVSAGTMTINPFLYSGMAFDPVEQLTCVSQMVSGMMVISVSPQLPVRSVKELVAYAKANPGKLNFGSGGNGTMSHMSLEMLNTQAGIKITHVPYRGTSLAVNDVIGGQIQGMFDTLSTSLPHFKAGRMRGLAVTGAHRSSQAPDLPTIQEAGEFDYVADAWAGLVGPAGLPPDILQALQQATDRVAEMPEFRDRVLQTGNEPVKSSPQAFSQLVRSDSAKWSHIIKISGAHVD